VRGLCGVALQALAGVEAWLPAIQRRIAAINRATLQQAGRLALGEIASLEEVKQRLRELQRENGTEVAPRARGRPRMRRGDGPDLGRGGDLGMGDGLDGAPLRAARGGRVLEEADDGEEAAAWQGEGGSSTAGAARGGSGWLRALLPAATRAAQRSFTERLEAAAPPVPPSVQAAAAGTALLAGLLCEVLAFDRAGGAAAARAAVEAWRARFPPGLQEASSRWLQDAGWLACRQGALQPTAQLVACVHGGDERGAGLLARAATAARRLDRLLGRATASAQPSRAAADPGAAASSPAADAEAAAEATSQEAERELGAAVGDAEAVGAAALAACAEPNPASGCVLLLGGGASAEAEPGGGGGGADVAPEVAALLLARAAAGRLVLAPAQHLAHAWLPEPQPAEGGEPPLLAPAVRLAVTPACTSPAAAAGSAAGAPARGPAAGGLPPAAVGRVLSGEEAAAGLRSRSVAAADSEPAGTVSGAAAEEDAAAEEVAAAGVAGDTAARQAAWEAARAELSASGGGAAVAAAEAALGALRAAGLEGLSRAQLCETLSAGGQEPALPSVLRCLEAHGLVRCLAPWDEPRLFAAEHATQLACCTRPWQAGSSAGGGEASSSGRGERVWRAVAARLLWLVSRFPGAPEEHLVAALPALPPVAVREALAQLAAHGRLEVRLAGGGSGAGDRRPGFLMGGQPRAEAQAPVRHFFPVLSWAGEPELLLVPPP
jgi:hypothetical protein